MRIVQLSDLHLRPGRLYSDLDPWQNLEQALLRACALNPDLLLLSGDLADDGSTETYRHLSERLDCLPFPFWVLSGNHDHADRLAAAFPSQDWDCGNSAYFPVDRQHIAILALNTSIVGQEAGLLDAGHIAWLDRVCPPEQDIILALHHPPFAVGIPGMDVIGCAGGEQLSAWMINRPNVKAILCGHVHRYVVTLFAGRLAITCPSTVHQIAIAEGPLAWTKEMPGLLVHEYHPGQAFRSHYLPLVGAPAVRY